MWCIRKAASHNKDCLCFSLLPSHACLFVLWGGASGKCERAGRLAPLVSCWAGKTPNSPVPPPTQTFQLSLCCATYRSFHFGFCMTVLLVRKGYIACVPGWEIPRPTATKLVLNFREASDRSQHQCIAASCEEHQCIALEPSWGWADCINPVNDSALQPSCCDLVVAHAFPIAIYAIQMTISFSVGKFLDDWRKSLCKTSSIMLCNAISFCTAM